MISKKKYVEIQSIINLPVKWTNINKLKKESVRAEKKLVL